VYALLCRAVSVSACPSDSLGDEAGRSSATRQKECERVAARSSGAEQRGASLEGRGRGSRTGLSVDGRADRGEATARGHRLDRRSHRHQGRVRRLPQCLPSVDRILSQHADRISPRVSLGNCSREQKTALGPPLCPVADSHGVAELRVAIPSMHSHPSPGTGHGACFLVAAMTRVFHCLASRLLALFVFGLLVLRWNERGKFSLLKANELES
jgi:hypothetical protein